MSAHTKKHPIKAHSHGSTLVIKHHRHTYAIPKSVINKYQIDNEEPRKVTRDDKAPSLKSLFNKLDEQYTKAGVLLKGLRLRENLSQIEFAKKIDVTQANLSKMENGKRPIGKIIAKRIEKVFGTNYRYFLE
ncbi:MAG TPA: helix-turn-helix transcriptional regulator [Gammaproteobacteria bacterium]|jgi:DNA-binding XRE family transcriptional regulator|nr:helix-turn-helix transcriptional regulator [Gammaproteobacteria bacterium]